MSRLRAAGKDLIEKMMLNIKEETSVYECKFSEKLREKITGNKHKVIVVLNIWQLCKVGSKVGRFHTSENV